MLPELTAEELSACLDEQVESTLARCGVLRPPVDALEVAAALGLTVAEDATQPQRARCVTVAGYRTALPRSTILVRPDSRPERRQWAVAHEIGEHLAVGVFERLSVHPAEALPTAREEVSNYLAARLLLPTAWFFPEAEQCGWSLTRLKAKFATASHELLARRMLDGREGIVITIFDQGRVTLRRANTSPRAPAVAEVERRCWEIAHHKAKACRAAQGQLSVQAWPVHEPGWKREILRTAINEGYDAE